MSRSAPVPFVVLVVDPCGPQPVLVAVPLPIVGLGHRLIRTGQTIVGRRHFLDCCVPSKARLKQVKLPAALPVS